MIHWRYWTAQGTQREEFGEVVSRMLRYANPVKVEGELHLYVQEAR